MKKNIRHYFTPTASLIRQVVIYGIWLFILLMIQSTTGTSVSGVSRCVPALVLVAVSALGFFDSERVGGIAGIAAGWALDATSGAELCIMPLIGFVVGYFSGYVADKYLPRNFLPWGVCLGGVAVVNMICTVIDASLSGLRFRLFVLIWHTLLPQLLLTLLFGIPAGFITLGIVKLQSKDINVKQKIRSFGKGIKK